MRERKGKGILGDPLRSQYMMPGRRQLSFNGVARFRDLGGFAVDRRVTAWGRLFRTGELGQMNATDRATWQDIGVRTVVDLRTPKERTAAPGMEGAIPLCLTGRPIFEGAAVPQRYDADFIKAMYRGIVRDGAPVVGEVFRHLVEAPLPIVIHCAAGRDRTGLVVALLLLALGVDRPDVLDEHYAAAACADGPPSVSSCGQPTNECADVAAAALEEVLAFIDREHGGIRQYLVRCAAVPENCLRQLEHRYLTNDTRTA